ncbi:rCG29909 [Rattus norvegicus]|uniref:RCG29909 n=1 Tax=Rattus norvegicus TaxID=10116 RepID=A6IM81_RAT|nr:rCG29909 [Rattus norvegicus]
MSEEEITYSTVRFKISSEVQNQVRPKEPQRTREAVHRGKCFKCLKLLDFYAS